jgi:UDP-N-acetylmuramoyl-tripeptide--D-alanyl-D-alanine ligase
VGQRAHWIADEALQAGLPQSSVFLFPDSQTATEHLRSTIGAGDVVLVKGSRGMHMDEIVTALEEDA